MTLGEAARIAAASLWSHKLRSALTLLGVVIGVMSVIAVVSLVSGLNKYVAEKVVQLGSDVVMINRSPSTITDISQWEEAQKRKKFHYDDYLALRDTCRSCVAVGGSLNRRGQAKYGTDYISDADIIGFTHEMPEMNSRELSEGRNITRLDVERAAPVCDVGFDIVDKLLPGVDPVGKEIRVDTGMCEIVGVGKKRGSVMGQSQDNWVILPLTTYQRMYASDDSVRLWAKAPEYTRARLHDGRSAYDFARAPARGVQGRGRFCDGDEWVVSHAVGQHLEHILRRDDRDCLDCARRRRHRDHEHHAGIGHGADAGNRPAEIARRASERHPDAILDRIVLPGGRRGSRRRDFRDYTWRKS